MNKQVYTKNLDPCKVACLAIANWLSWSSIDPAFSWDCEKKIRTGYLKSSKDYFDKKRLKLFLNPFGPKKLIRIDEVLYDISQNSQQMDLNPYEKHLYSSRMIMNRIFCPSESNDEIETN